jgi:hypothetical protein
MMGFVIEHHDVFHAHQVGHYPLEHLSFGFQGVKRFTAALQQ